MRSANPRESTTRRCSSIASVSLALTLALLVGVRPCRADADAAKTTPALTITVVDAEKYSPVAGAEAMVLRDARPLASGVTDANGSVAFVTPSAHQAAAQHSATAGAVQLEIKHPDYQLARVPVTELSPGSAVRVLLIPVVVITVFDRRQTSVGQAATTLRGLELQESLRGNVPETIAGVPGVAVTYNGPGAAQPTIRGMGGDRVLVLEDGFRSGDLYWSASDHGVMIEPLTARRIEVLRGPASLVYGGNALGGVVNVIREDIPRQWDSVSGRVGVQAESGSEGLAQGGDVLVPIGPFTLRLEESIRRSGDVRTPRGKIPNTGTDAWGTSAGLGFHPSWGELGASVRYYQNTYGVPGEFDGQLIPGGHPGGATIEARRANGRLRATYLPSPADGIESIELSATFTRYMHDEVEGVIDGQRAIGAAFDLDTLQSNVVVRHRSERGGHAWRGATGVALTKQDLSTGGASPGVRSGSDWGLAAFAFEELSFDSLSLHAGARYDQRSLFTKDLAPIRVRTAEREIEKVVVDRRFHLLSGSLAAMWEAVEGWTLGTTLARSSRAPNLQELYSDGPHLADFSFDIGTPSLPPEVGTGVDIFLIAKREIFTLEATGFVNLVDDYVQYTPTLESVRVFREGARPRTTPVFESRAVDALFVGAEGSASLSVGWGFSVQSTISYVHAERRSNSDPLPFIAPLHGRAALRYERAGLFASIGASGAARQSRVPQPVAAGEGMERPQEPTDGYALLHASAGWSGDAFGLRHSVTARGSNLANRLWRDHLSRIKEVAPQMGLDLALTYRVQF